MKTFLRMAVLLGLVGVGYGLGRTHQDTPMEKIKTAPTLHPPVSKNSKSAKKKGPYFVTVDDIQRLLADPNIPWAEKEDYFMKVLLPGMDSRDIPDFIKLITEFPAPFHAHGDKSEMLVLLFRTLAKANPEATLELMSSYPHDSFRPPSLIIGEALGAMAVTDPQRAFSLLNQYLPAGAPNSRAYTMFFGTWADEKPAEASAAALSLPPGQERENALESAAGFTWAEHDPQAAIHWAQSLSASDSYLRSVVFRSALQTEAQDGTFDKQTTLNEINQVKSLRERNDLISSASDFLADYGKPADAIELLNQNLSGIAYDTRINQIFNYYGSTDLSTMTVALDKITDPGARAGAIATLAQHAAPADSADPFGPAQGNPAELFQWAQSLPEADAEARTAALNTILPGFSKANPAAAAGFIENAADPSAYLSAAPAIAQNLAKIDPDAALSWVSDLPEGTGKDQAMGTLLANLAQTDADAAWSYAASLPEGASRDTVMTSLVTATAKNDPAQAANLAEQMPAGSAQLSAISSVSATWVKQDPQAFTVWLNGLPAGGQRDAAVVQLASSSSAQEDPAAVLAWVNTVADAETKTSYMASVLSTWAVGEPQAALAWANTVGDAQTRASNIERVLVNWAVTDAPAALNAAQTANLTAAQRAAAVQKINQVQTGNKQ